MSKVIISGVYCAELRNIIERLEHLEQEKSETNDRINSVFSEAKAEGFDVKVIRNVIRIRKMNKEEHKEYEELVDLYLRSLY